MDAPGSQGGLKRNANHDDFEKAYVDDDDW